MVSVDEEEPNLSLLRPPLRRVTGRRPNWLDKLCHACSLKVNEKLTEQLVSTIIPQTVQLLRVGTRAPPRIDDVDSAFTAVTYS
jgi:hypothetical protein